MKNKTLYLSVGIFVIIGVLALIFMALKVSGLTRLSSESGYSIRAVFDNVGDLKPRAPVTMAGVKVGQVISIHLNPTTYRAIVMMNIDSDIKLPGGTSASIFTAGLLGANYISLTPGYEQTNLKPGSTIEDTHPAIILENLIGQLIFSTSSKQKS